MAKVLEVENVTMQFGGVVAVNNLNMEVKEGEIVALIGPNGAGKTTAFNVITGVYQPTNGRVAFRGETIIRNHPQGKMKKLYKGEIGEYYTREKVLAPTPDRITALGMARTFQNIRLWKTQTVFDNVLIAKHHQTKHNFVSAMLRMNEDEEKAQRRRVKDLLEIVGLWDERNELATSLPYGKQHDVRKLTVGITEGEQAFFDPVMQGEGDLVRRHVETVRHFVDGQQDRRIQRGTEKIEIELQRKFWRFREIFINEFHRYIEGRKGLFGPENELFHSVT